MPSEEITAKIGKLKRTLGLFEVTMYGVGIILGAGIYALIGKAAGIAGPALWAAFGIGGFVALLTGLSYAELGAMFPKEAAEFVYTKKAFGRSLLSFLVGWLIIIVGCVAAATVALGFGGYFQAITGVPQLAAAVGLIAVMSYLNFYGIKESSRANILFTIIEASGLILIILLGLGHLGSVNYLEAPAGIEGIFMAAILVFFAYLGFEDIVNIAEETKKPTRVIPRALLLSILITTIIYVLVSVSAVSILPWQTLGTSAAPMADIAQTALPGLGPIMAFIALFATANTVLVLLIVESRMAWGMAHAKALPKPLALIHPRRCTPWTAIIATSLLTVAFVFFGNIRTVAEITDFGAFLIFLSVNVSLIWLRFTRPNIRRPFKVPLNIGRFPVLPALGAAFCVGMLFFFSWQVVSIGIAILVIGVLFHKAMQSRIFS